METLKGHIAIISGGLGDIGKGIACELADRGVDVAVGDFKDDPKLSADFINQINSKGRKAKINKVDVSDYKAVASWIKEVEDDLGIADIIISCAAQATIGDVLDITPLQWKRELDVNLTGTFYLAQIGAKRLIDTGNSGNIILIGSWAGHHPQTHNTAYCVSKAGITALMKGLALRLSPYGILVNEVAPGNVDAGLSGRYYENHPEDKIKDTKVAPVRKLITTDELAWHIANICDPRTKNITGTTIFIDGGLSILPNMRENN